MLTNKSAIFQRISSSSSGTTEEVVFIEGKPLEITYNWDKRRIELTLTYPKSTIITTDSWSIRRIDLLVYSNYAITGSGNHLSEKILANSATVALLKWPKSKISCTHQTISFSAKLRRKNIGDTEKIFRIFKNLCNNNYG